MHPTTIAVDLAKTVFEVAVADPTWHVVARHRFSRRQFARFLQTAVPARVVMEACATAHFWGRVAQHNGHDVTLLPPHYVRPYVRRGKTDRTDAEALLEACRSGELPAVPVKTVAHQELVALHRARQHWLATRTARINAVRGFLREHGIDLPSGAHSGVSAIPAILEDADHPVPGRLREILAMLYEEIRETESRLARVDHLLSAVAADDPIIPRLLEIPGVGPITATALVGSVAHIHAFRRARFFASWLGLTPREHSSGGRRRLGAITKRGDVYLRCLLTHGARAVLLAAYRAQRAGKPVTALQNWALTVAARRGHNKATVAVANKLARIIWAVWHRDSPFVNRPAAAA